MFKIVSHTSIAKVYHFIPNPKQNDYHQTIYQISQRLAQLCIVAALVAACSAAPSPPAGLYYQSTPLLAKYAPAPLAPASTVHAAHVAAALAPQTLYAASAPLATYAYAAPALAYDSGYSVITRVTHSGHN